MKCWRLNIFLLVPGWFFFTYHEPVQCRSVSWGKKVRQKSPTRFESRCLNVHSSSSTCSALLAPRSQAGKESNCSKGSLPQMWSQGQCKRVPWESEPSSSKADVVLLIHCCHCTLPFSDAFLMTVRWLGDKMLIPSLTSSSVRFESPDIQIWISRDSNLNLNPTLFKIWLHWLAVKCFILNLASSSVRKSWRKNRMRPALTATEAGFQLSILNNCCIYPACNIFCFIYFFI